MRSFMVPAIKDAIVFHSSLNPAIWGDENMLPEVRADLMKIMDDFREFLGVDDLDIVDITVSGSNAAYTYTPHSDIDLHLVVNIPSNQDKIFTELFDAKKSLYNLTRNIKVRGYDVELYVQDSKNPVESMGLYSVLRNKWVSYPRRVKAQINDVSVLARVQIYTRRINDALASDDIELSKRVWRDFRAMRKAGLDKSGEFSPENLAFKILRTREMSNKLYDHIIALKDKQLSLEHIEEARVDELFNTPSKKRIINQDDSLYMVECDIGDSTITFEAEVDEDHKGLVWTVEFNQTADDVNPWEKHAMTGKGNEFAVMSFIKACMHDFFTLYQPERVAFSAEKEQDSISRTQVYASMIKRYLPAEYSFTSQDYGPDIQFEITRNDAIDESVINELFNAPTRKLVVADNNEEFKTQAAIGGRVIVFTAKYVPYMRSGDIWGNGWAITFYERAAHGNDVGLTGNGKEFDVLSFIKASMVDLLTKHDPNNITFDAAATKNGSRVGTYDRMVQRFLSTKYDVLKYEDQGSATFLLKKKA